MVTGAHLFMCGCVIRKMRIFAITAFLNNNSLLFGFLSRFRSEGVGYVMKSRRRWSNGEYLTLAISKIQHDRSDNILKRDGMAENIEDGLLFLLMTKKVLTKSFKVL